MKSKLSLLFTFFVLSSAAYAECPVTLPYDQLMDCIVVEGAGETYLPNTVDGMSVEDSKKER